MKRVAFAGTVTVLFACVAATTSLWKGTPALDVTVKWSVDLTAQQLTQSHHSSPNVCDVDGDGKNEILFVYRKDAARLVCFKDDGSVKWLYPPLGTDPIGQSLAKPTIADINKDGKLEVLIGGRDKPPCRW